jgi:hypothetical protein
MKPDLTKNLPPDPAPAPAEMQHVPLTLEEFCMRLSQRDRRIELIAMFHHDTLHRVGKKTGIEPDFQDLFKTFCKE